MARVSAARGAQNVQALLFEFSFDDTVIDINGVERKFNEPGTFTFEMAVLPQGAFLTAVQPGFLVEEFTGATKYEFAFENDGGDGGALNLVGPPNKALSLPVTLKPDFVGHMGGPVRATVTIEGTPTAGRAALGFRYTVLGRVNEVTA